jgi:Ca2+-binding EF-hand superfamily protein
MSDSQLSTDQQNEYREMFQYFDRDKTGFLDLKQLKLLMRALGEDPTEAELNRMAPSGKIDFNAFLANRQEKWAKAQSGEDVKNAFAFFDLDGSGRANVAELQRILTTYGEPLTQEEMNRLIQDADGQSGTIDYNRFVDKMKKNTY